MKYLTLTLSLIAILLTLIAGSYFHYRILEMRADTNRRLIEIQETAEVASEIAQDLQAEFIRNKRMINDAIEGIGGCGE